MTRPFSLDLGWLAILTDLGVRPADLLRQARLPEDLFSRERPTADPQQFIRLWEALTETMGLPDPGLVLGQAIPVEAFNPPLFAAFCSPDLSTALERLSRFKPLISPMRLDLADLRDGLEVTYGTDGQFQLPTELMVGELVFLVQLARQATRSHMVPVAVEMPAPPDSPAYTGFFGRDVREGPSARLVFSYEDASRPFFSANPALFAAFEPELRARLDEVAASATLSDRVRAALMEALPSGQAEVAPVAKRLGVSTRSLQRKLSSEGTSFKAELTDLRERLARDYLTNTSHSSAEISYLLGYEDPNSFIRAFHGWTGTTPEAMRARVQVG